MIHLIEKTNDLEEFCHHLETQEFITIDLEFLREKTYYRSEERRVGQECKLSCRHRLDCDDCT